MFFASFLNVTGWLDGAGAVAALVIIGAIVFAESGLLLGFFLPGDTLLLSAGIFAAQGKLSLAWLLVVISAAAIIGDNLGYHLGRTLGPRLFRKKDGVLFRQEYVKQAEAFFHRFGTKTMLLAHFLPIVRTFAPIVAGVGHMNHKQFIIYDAIGDIAWAVSVTMVGYWFGSRIPDIDHYIMYAVALAIAASFGPMVYHIGKAYYESRKAKREATPPRPGAEEE